MCYFHMKKNGLAFHVSCGYNRIKQKNEQSRIQRKKLNSKNRLKYAEHRIFCICIDVYKLYEGDDYDKMFEVSSKKNKE